MTVILKSNIKIKQLHQLIKLPIILYSIIITHSFISNLFFLFFILLVFFMFIIKVLAKKKKKKVR